MPSPVLANLVGITAHARIPYRGGRVYDRFLVIGASPVCDAIHKGLADQLSKTPDNHTTYLVTDGDETCFGIHFSDGRAYFGKVAPDDQVVWDYAVETCGLDAATLAWWTDPEAQ